MYILSRVMTNKYLTIKEAASYLGVTPLTLRNWDKSGKLKASRHPMSNYRVYKTDDLEKVIKDIESGLVVPRARKAPERKKAVARKLIVRHLED
jgi:excisionase family DNA binding protein